MDVYRQIDGQLDKYRQMDSYINMNKNSYVMLKLDKTVLKINSDKIKKSGRKCD